MGETDNQQTETPATDTPQPDYTVLNDFIDAYRRISEAQTQLQQHQAAYAEGGEVTSNDPTGGITPEIEFLLNQMADKQRPPPPVVMQQPPQMPQPMPMQPRQYAEGGSIESEESEDEGFMGGGLKRLQLAILQDKIKRSPFVSNIPEDQQIDPSLADRIRMAEHQKRVNSPVEDPGIGQMLVEGAVESLGAPGMGPLGALAQLAASPVGEVEAAIRPKFYYHGSANDFKEHAPGLIPLAESPHVAETYASGAGGNRASKATAFYSDSNTGDVIEQIDDETLMIVAGPNKGKRLPADTEELQDMGIYPTEDWDKIKQGANVREYAVDTEKTLDLRHTGYDRNGLPLNESWKAIAELDPQGDRFADAIIRGTGRNKLFSWSDTKYPGHQDAWRDVLIPQLREKGYDSIEYWDDMHPTLAVFADKQLKPSYSVRLPTQNRARQDEAITNLQAFLAKSTQSAAK